MEIKTADKKIVNEGDKVFSHYTMSFGIIENAKEWGKGDGEPIDIETDIWFDFVAEDGKRDLLNGERICKEKPSWIRS